MINTFRFFTLIFFCIAVVKVEAESVKEEDDDMGVPDRMVVAAPEDSDEVEDGSAQWKDKGDRQIFLKVMLPNPEDNAAPVSSEDDSAEKLKQIDQQNRQMVEHLTAIQKLLDKLVKKVRAQGKEIIGTGFALLVTALTCGGCVFLMLIAIISAKNQPRCNKRKKKKIMVNVSASGSDVEMGLGQLPGKGNKQQSQVDIILDKEDGAQPLRPQMRRKGVGQSSLTDSPSDEAENVGDQPQGQLTQHKPAEMVALAGPKTPPAVAKKPMGALLEQLMRESRPTEEDHMLPPRMMQSPRARRAVAMEELPFRSAGPEIPIPIHYHSYAM